MTEDVVVESVDSVKSAQDLQQGATMMSEDNSFRELDVAPFLDRIYNELLGNVVNEAGVWINDGGKACVMNSLGASEFVQEVSIRLSIHQQLSELSEFDIVEIASIGAENYADKMEDNFLKWSIVSTEANFNSIAWRMFHVLFENLMICKGAGMRKYRERSKNPMHYSVPQVQEGVL